jgi:hypothetical protein
VKVIERAPAKKPWSAEAECIGYGNGSPKGCGSKLLVEEGDLYKTYRDYSRENAASGIYPTFTCPVCHAETDVPLKGFSSHLLARLPARGEHPLYQAARDER